MGTKNRDTNGPSTPARAMNQAVSLREETSGRTHIDEASLLRVKHLQRLAAWVGAEAGVDPVGALLGHRLATSAEATGVPLSATSFLCQRCETILKPGFNCTVRIRNKRNKANRRKKSKCCQNNISYACHFCGDLNLILGSGKGVVKSLLPSREHTAMDSSHGILRGNNSNTTRDTDEILEHYQAAIWQGNPPFGLRQSTSERGEHGERLNCNIPIDSKMEEGVVLSMKPGNLVGSTSEDDSIRVLENTNDEQMHETKAISSEKVKKCEAKATSQAEVPVGSAFVTPQKKKLIEVAAQDGSAFVKTESKASKKVENSTGNTLSSFSKSASNDSRKNMKSAASDSCQVSGSSRKRARKGWTTLKQIAEKDELERKQKMGNFVIPFFMQ